jgi:hypothetical protein
MEFNYLRILEARLMTRNKFHPVDIKIFSRHGNLGPGTGAPLGYVYMSPTNSQVGVKLNCLTIDMIAKGLYPDSTVHIFSFHSLSWESYTASSQASSPNSEIECFLFQVPVSSLFVKINQ